MIKNKKTKKGNQLARVQTLAIKKEEEISLEKLRENFENHFDCFMLMLAGVIPYKIKIDDNVIFTQQALVLREAIKANFKKSKARAEKLFDENFFCNDTLILHLRITILHASFEKSLGDVAGSFRLYVYAYKIFVSFNKLLNYENNLPFQQHILTLLETLTEYKSPVPEVHDYLEQAKIDIAGFYQGGFTSKCGDTLAKLAIVYDELIEKIYKANNQPSIELKNEREDFFALARRVKNSYAKVKTNTGLPSEFLLMSIEANYFMLNISEITHPNSVWKAVAIDTKVNFLLTGVTIGNKNFRAYFSFWQSLSKIYIGPTAALIKQLNIQELTSEPNLATCYHVAQQRWLEIFTKTSLLFECWTVYHLSIIESMPKLKPKFWHELDVNCLKMETEINYLSTQLDLMAEVADQYRQELKKKRLDTYMVDEIANAQQKLENLKNRHDSLRLKITSYEKLAFDKSNEGANELIKEVDQKRALYEEKLRKRQASKPKADFDFQNPEESESEEEEAPAPLVIPNPSLELLEKVDLDSITLARTLKAKIKVFHAELVCRFQQDIVVRPTEQNATFREISHILIHYYDLVALHQKHETLSQVEEIKSQIELQLGIKVSQIELRETCLLIHNKITMVNSLYNEIKIRAEQGKDKKIYELGEAHFKNKKIEATEAQIIEEGTKIFRRIGRSKINRGEELSDYAKQREFLNLMQLAFASLGYLQTKLKPFIFENYNEGLHKFSLFSSEKSEFSIGRFHGMFAIILKHLYEEDGDITHLHKALTHAVKAYDYYFKRSNNSALSGISYQLAMISDKLAEENPDNPELKAQAQKYYQATLDFNAQANSKYDLDELEEIKLRIEALEGPNASQATLRL